MESEKLAAFQTLKFFVQEEDINLNGICPIFLEHLDRFVSELDWYILSNNHCKIFNRI